MSLDLSNAFNAAWVHYIRYELSEAGINYTLGRICESFLQEREVIAGKVNRKLWLVAMQGWFKAIRQAQTQENSAIQAQAYADDQMIIIRASSAKKIERIWSSTWEACQKWAQKGKATYNEKKRRSCL